MVSDVILLKWYYYREILVSLPKWLLKYRSSKQNNIKKDLFEKNPGFTSLKNDSFSQDEVCL